MAIQDFLTNVASKVASNFMSAANQRNNTNTANNNNAMFKAANNAKQKKTGTSSTSTFNPNRSYTEQTINQMSNMINQPFEYNPQTDAAAQSAIKAAERQMKKNQDSSYVDMVRRGIGNSSVSETIQNQIAGQTAENIATNIIPFYQQQAYQQYQDRIGNLGNLYSYQNQEYFQNPIQEAQVTGNYLTGPARQAIQSILNLKQQAETPGITPQQLQGLSQQAQTYRDQLDSMGIDSSQFGADVTRQQSLANYARAGVPTLEAARMNWDQSPENPVNQGQQLQNQMYQYELDELMNPESRSNIMKDLELQVAQMEADYLPQEQKLKLQQLQRQIANIGARPPQTSAEAEYDRLRVEQLRREIELMGQESQNPSKIDPKESADNYSQARNYVDNLDYQTAMQYAQGIRDYLSDSDYRSLVNYIDENL